MGNGQRVLGEVDAPVVLHGDHGAAGVVAVLLIDGEVRQVHQGALDHAVVDHAARGLHDAVLGIVHRVAQAHREAFRDLRVEVQPGIDAVVVRRGDDTVLIHVADAGHVSDGLGSARDGDVVAHDSGIGEEFVLPVGIVLRGDGRPGREVVEHVGDSDLGQGEAFGSAHRVVVIRAPRHAGSRGTQAVGVVAGIDQQIAELRGVQQLHLMIELLDSIREVIADFGGLALLAALGGDQDDARGAARTVDCGRCGIFQNVDRLDVVRVDVDILRSGISVDHIEGIAAGREGVDAADADRHAVAGAPLV